MVRAASDGFQSNIGPFRRIVGEQLYAGSLEYRCEVSSELFFLNNQMVLGVVLKEF
jgi:hypothetical protein